MNKKEWLEILEKQIKSVPKKEREGVISYYNEIIDDGIEHGQSEEQIVQRLGNPYDVAQKILDENDQNNSSQNQDEINDETQNTQNSKTTKKYPLWLVFVVGFFVVVVGIPLFGGFGVVLISLFITFWALFGTFAITAIACFIAIFVAIFMAIAGTIQGGGALIGACIMGVGVCILLAVGFWFVSIYTSRLLVSIYKLLKKGGKKV